jgi:hypothetical protein
MVVETLGEFIEQCEMANFLFGRNDCCTSGCPKNPACNHPGWPLFAQYGYTFDHAATPLSWQQIKDQICAAKKPMAYAYGPQSGGVGHVVVIYGFIEDGPTQSLLIEDPWAPCRGRVRVLPYQEYAGSLTTNHWSTMYNVAKTP